MNTTNGARINTINIDKNEFGKWAIEVNNLKYLGTKSETNQQKTKKLKNIFQFLRKIKLIIKN